MRRSGFSLLEILVTLAILGLAIAVAAPTVGGIYDAVRFRAGAGDIALSAASMRVDAAITGRAMVFPRDYGAASENPQLVRRAPVPEGWRIAGDEIVFLPNGVCLGGVIEISDDSGRRARYRLEPPGCEPVPLSE